MKKIILFCSLAFSINAFALFGEDVALMVQLVTTTASQLNELEKLVTNAEKYTQKLQEYNSLVQDEYFKAERVLYLAESMSSQRRVENLGELNSAISNLKYSLEEMNTLMREYALIKNEEKKAQTVAQEGKRLNQMNRKRAQDQVANSLNAREVKRAQQITAQNTALMYEAQVESNDNQLELLKKISTTNRLLAEEREEKRSEQIARARTYGLLDRELKQ